MLAILWLRKLDSMHGDWDLLAKTIKNGNEIKI